MTDDLRLRLLAAVLRWEGALGVAAHPPPLRDPIPDPPPLRVDESTVPMRYPWVTSPEVH